MHNKRSQKTLKYFLLLIILIIATSLFLYFQYNSSINTPVDPSDDTPVSFQIRKGETPKQIAKNLELVDLIHNEFTFYLYLKFNDLGQNIIAGRFLLNKTMTAPQIIETISDPAQAEFIIIIQEGLMIRDIDEKLADLGLIEHNDFIQAAKSFDGWEYYSFLDQQTLQTLKIPIEGYLYPDTYFLDPEEFQPHDLIYLAMDNFEQKTAELLPEISRHTVHEIITMASLIENEVFGAEDRKIVSGILWKRLENDWTLGADAALLYITDDREISAEDLEIDSPYNIRKVPGLPPGPISNPGLESIEAAAHPTETEYWFYLTTEKSEVIYSITNDEHNENKAKYL
jgi:UPF0755 protein